MTECEFIIYYTAAFMRDVMPVSLSVIHDVWRTGKIARSERYTIIIFFAYCINDNRPRGRRFRGVQFSIKTKYYHLQIFYYHH